MALIITSTEVSVALNAAYTDAEVGQAQDVVELFSGGLDLYSEDHEARFSPSDLRNLRNAVQWQAKYQRENPDVLTREVFKRASANGASIERFDGDTDPALAPLARLCLKRLSSAAPGFAIQTLRPRLQVTRTQPDPWVRMG